MAAVKRSVPERNYKKSKTALFKKKKSSDFENYFIDSLNIDGISEVVFC